VEAPARTPTHITLNASKRSSGATLEIAWEEESRMSVAEEVSCKYVSKFILPIHLQILILATKFQRSLNPHSSQTKEAL
jgi:hypothetical protein